MGDLKRVVAFVTTLALTLILASCEYSEAEKESSDSYAVSAENSMNHEIEEKKHKFCGR